MILVSFSHFFCLKIFTLICFAYKVSFINTFTHLSGRNVITSNSIVRTSQYHKLGEEKWESQAPTHHASRLSDSFYTSGNPCRSFSNLFLHILKYTTPIILLLSYSFPCQRLSHTEEWTNVHLHLSYPNS